MTRDPFLAGGGIWDFGWIRVWGWGIRWRRGRCIWGYVGTRPLSRGFHWGHWSITWLWPGENVYSPMGYPFKAAGNPEDPK